MKRVFLVSASLFSASAMLCGAVQADQASVIQCIKRYKEVGISADAAFAECNKETLLGCVKNLLGKNYVARSIEKRPNGYLIDLGNDQSRWLEGGGWERKGCKAFTKGPNRAEVADPGKGLLRVGKYNYTWFRQGTCPSNELELSQPYGIEDAKLQCELNALQANKVEDLCSSKLGNYGCSYNNYLDTYPSIKAWAEANPGMAQKERLRLNSID